MRYDFQCKCCGKVFELVRTVDERNDPASCPECGSEASRQEVYPFRAHVWVPHYVENITEEPMWIESKKQLRQECYKRGLIPLAVDG